MSTMPKPPHVYSVIHTNGLANGHWQIIKEASAIGRWFQTDYWEAYRVWCHLKGLSWQDGVNKYYDCLKDPTKHTLSGTSRARGWHKPSD